MHKEWKLYIDDDELVNQLVKELGISKLTAKILCHRGIETVEEAEIFLNPETKQKFHNPFLMKDMDNAVSRIEQAINGKERIVVYGDYDVDGMSASAIMLRALKKLGATVSAYIPDRQSEGYGFNVPALHKIADSGASLLISVDCGISNVKEIEEVKERLDVIVTDHHLPSVEIDNAVAVIDPHQDSCKYPDKNLCGAGVAFKLCQALNNKINGIDFDDYIDDVEIATLGTIADIVPLAGENRKIVRLGLAKMTKTDNIGLKSLIEVSGLMGKKISAGHVGYSIAPRLNAAGRLATAAQGLKLLTTESEFEAKKIAERLNAENTQRKEIERELLEAADKKFNKLREERGGDVSAIIISGENWHPGVIGLTASRLLEKYYLPSIIISNEGEFSRGSCRSINALHMKNALDKFNHYFTQYGGHSAAAGFTIHTSDVESFSREFENYVKETLKDEDFIPQQMVDAIVDPLTMSVEQAEEIAKLEPFGVGNPHPVFAYKNVKGDYARTMGKNNEHLSFYINSNDDDNKTSIRAVAWHLGAFTPLVNNELIDITFVPDKNEWNDQTSVQCNIESLEPARENGNFPNRDALINIYQFLRQRSNSDKMQPFDICKFNADFKQSRYRNSDPKFNSIYTFNCALQIFEELGFINFDVDGNYFSMPENPNKLNLNRSRFWRLNQ